MFHRTLKPSFLVFCACHEGLKILPSYKTFYLLSLNNDYVNRTKSDKTFIYYSQL